MGPETRQGHVDLARLVARIRNEFPALRFMHAALNDLGEDHAVVLLDDRWVFRFARSAEAARADTVERHLLSRLQQVSPVVTPRYEHVSSTREFGGYPKIAGVELTEAIFAALPRAAQERVLADIGGFLGALHALPADLVPPSGEDAAWFHDRYMERRGHLADALGPALLDAADRFFRALPAAVVTTDASVIHRDLTEDHLLLDPQAQRLAGVIDFTDARLGDPAFDFTFLWAYGRNAPALALRRYGEAAKHAGILTRSLWWFTRYRIDQIWWSVSGARGYDVAGITGELKELFVLLGL